ncbi:MAG: hypothetical protein LBM71_00760 [Elusimicrobiota bacterium]|jgi:hypothetical protein|nr:hypothetical protein [Elusimicrobiota bacterium]
MYFKLFKNPNGPWQLDAVNYELVFAKKIHLPLGSTNSWVSYKNEEEAVKKLKLTKAPVSEMF